MAGRMPGRKPNPPKNPIGAVLQKIRMEAGIPRREIGMPASVELSIRRPEWLFQGTEGAQRILSGLAVEPMELMEVTLMTISDRELVIIALGRMLERRNAMARRERVSV